MRNGQFADFSFLCGKQPSTSVYNATTCHYAGVQSRARLKFVSGQQYMKRRSARPFVVELKSTRSSRSSLSDAFTRTRPSSSLWDGVALEAEAKPSAPQIQPRSPVAEVPKAAAQEPSRRVLPALVPLYVPPEPEPQDEAHEGLPVLPALRRLSGSRVPDPLWRKRQMTWRRSLPRCHGQRL